jgi:sugar/nucleoside kinase (ribokinase family)
LLGIPTTLMGKIGADAFGDIICEILRRYGTGLDHGMVRAPGEVTSYTAVINIPGVDRTFLHCPGANHHFGAADVLPAKLAGASLFHLGYPPIMARTYADDGVELVEIYRRVKAAGLTSSLDMVVPDPNGPGGRANWGTIFERTLPNVDIFLPSADELLYVLDRPSFGEGDKIGPDKVSSLGRQMLGLGVGVAGVKLGSRGLYLRTAGRARLAALGAAGPVDAGNWADRELWFPVFEIAKFVGATGAGDATIAGFLAAFLRGQTIEAAGAFANAVGACNVQTADALSGIKSWDETQRRLAAGWKQVPLHLAAPGWRRDDRTGIWHGPNDRPA